MSKPKLHITDARMLELIEILKQSGTIKFRQEFCDALDIHKQLIRQIKIKKQHFTAAHISLVCKIYNVNANWIMGIEDNIFRNTKLRQRVSRIKIPLKSGRANGL